MKSRWTSTLKIGKEIQIQMIISANVESGENAFHIAGGKSPNTHSVQQECSSECIPNRQTIPSLPRNKYTKESYTSNLWEGGKSQSSHRYATFLAKMGKNKTSKDYILLTVYIFTKKLGKHSKLVTMVIWMGE